MQSHYTWHLGSDLYSLSLTEEFKSVQLKLRTLPRGTKIEPLGIDQRVNTSWRGPSQKTEIDTALDIKGANAELVIARFLAGEFKYGAAYTYYAGSRIRPDIDFEDTAQFFERINAYFGISAEQLKAFFTNSNLPEEAKLSVKSIL